MSKRIMSVILVAILVLSMGTVAMTSVSANKAELPAKAEGYNRYYFYMPYDMWVDGNAYTQTAGIYWWEGTDACSSWPGYEAISTGVEGVYYYDVPQDVTTIIWNNAIDGGTDPEAEIYTAAYQTKNIGSEYYDVDESVNYPDGTPNFDEMIYVLDLSKTDINEYSGKATFSGEWFYYYGNGEYGFTPEKGDVVYSDRAYYEVPGQASSGDEETTTAPVEENNGITTGGTTYEANVGDIITYTFDITTPDKIENVQASTTYDAAKLKLVDTPNTERFPNLTGLVANAQEGVIYFNASDISTGYDFTAGATLITLQFEVLDATASAITTTIEEMVQFFGDDFVTGGVVVEGVDLKSAETLVVPEPVVTTTVAETTVAETTVAETTVSEPAETTTTEATEPTETEPVVETEPVETEPVEDEEIATPDEPATEDEPATDDETATEDEPVIDEPVIDEPVIDEPVVEPETDAQGATDAPADKPADTVPTGVAATIYVVLAFIAMAAAAAVVLRKKANG